MWYRLKSIFKHLYLTWGVARCENVTVARNLRTNISQRYVNTKVVLFI